MRIGRDFIGVSAGVVIRNEAGEYFLAKRSSGARDDRGKWEFPGGSVGFGETREAAVLRNVVGKYGIRIVISGVLGVYDVIDELAGDHWVSTTYLGRLTSGEPTILTPEKCDEIGWFTLETIKQMSLSRVSQMNLADLIGRNAGGAVH